MRLYGTPYPIVQHPKGFLHTVRGIDAVKADLLILLLTNPGERVMLPTFGTPLRQLQFEPNDATLQAQAKQMIIKAIQQWEPRIVINAINVLNGPDPSALNPADDGSESDSVLTIQISFYDPQNIQAVQDLVLEVTPSMLSATNNAGTSQNTNSLLQTTGGT